MSIFVLATFDISAQAQTKQGIDVQTWILDTTAGGYERVTYSSSYAGSRALGSTQLSYQMAPLYLGTGRVNVIDRGVNAFEIFLDVIAVADRNDLLPALAMNENASDGWRRRPMMAVSAATGSGTADREYFLIVGVDVVMVRSVEQL